MTITKVKKKSISRSIRFKEEDIQKLKEIAEKENIKISTVINKAILTYLKSYKNPPSDSAEMNNRISDLEKKFGSLLNRVNILTTQVDKILQRLR